jgi:hypothetical protein
MLKISKSPGSKCQVWIDLERQILLLLPLRMPDNTLFEFENHFALTGTNSVNRFDFEASK